jgi:hypothetical protein
MISEHADLKALTVKDIITASDGTRKVAQSVSLTSSVIFFQNLINFETQDVTDIVLS